LQVMRRDTHVLIPSTSSPLLAGLLLRLAR
jgi:hypothetical protein